MKVLRTLIFCAPWAGCLQATPSGDTGPTDCTSDRFFVLQQSTGQDPCWTSLELTVECDYWSEFLAQVGEEQPEGCSPLGWTAVHDGQCVMMSVTCPGDPRDPDFLDCSGLPGCCEAANNWGGCEGSP